jgi:hypothetical protein
LFFSLKRFAFDSLPGWMASLDIYLGLFTIAVLRDENYYGATHTDHDRSVEGKEQFR